MPIVLFIGLNQINELKLKKAWFSRRDGAKQFKFCAPYRSMDLYRYFLPLALYESILCSYYAGTQEINSACIGVRCTSPLQIEMRVFSQTDTIQNLTPNVHFSVNFPTQFDLYFQSAMKGWNKGAAEKELPLELFRFGRNNTPYLFNSSVSILCSVKNVIPVFKSGEVLHHNIWAECKEIITSSQPLISHNRSFALLMECLIDLTRLKASLQKPSEDIESDSLVLRIQSNLNLIEKWSQNLEFQRNVKLIKKSFKLFVDD